MIPSQQMVDAWQREHHADPNPSSTDTTTPPATVSTPWEDVLTAAAQPGARDAIAAALASLPPAPPTSPAAPSTPAQPEPTTPSAPRPPAAAAAQGSSTATTNTTAQRRADAAANLTPQGRIAAELRRANDARRPRP